MVLTIGIPTKTFSPKRFWKVLKQISDKWAIMIMVALWAVVIAVADMNWPEHMGPQNALIEALGNLV